MSYSLQDQSLIISYIQIYLRDYFGITLTKVSSDSRRATPDSYEISQSETIKVTGVYTDQTYLSICLFMAYNYPEEQFPIRWDLRSKSSGEWIKTPFNQDKLTITMKLLLDNDAGKDTMFTQEMYETIVGAQENPNLYFSWEELLKYFYSEDDLYEVLYSKENKEYTRSDINHNLEVFLVHNLDQINHNKNIADIDDRIVSYFLEEVVSPISDSDEILRTQKIIYPQGTDYKRAGHYDDQMVEDVRKAQQNFIDLYTVVNDEGQSVTTLPEGYEGFKVTGYVDPWTELVIKGGLD